MRRVINSTFVSLDGAINHMERWHFDYIDDEHNKITLDEIEASDILLMGRATYEIYAQAWPQREGEYPSRINAITKYVASTTLEKADWANTTVIGSDLVGTVARLKQEGDGDILMQGFGPVARQLLDAGLLDELRLWFNPAFAGVGDVVWSEGVNVRLDLLGTRALGSGVVILSYAPTTG
jgi:dihydrofolate reductase